MRWTPGKCQVQSALSSLSLSDLLPSKVSHQQVSSFFLSLIKNAEEEKALREGVKRHGMGRWKYIKTDPEFSQCLTNRSNVDLKDKWRNILVAQGVSFCVCLSLCVCVCVFSSPPSNSY